ncbi:sensor histidine kinase [Sphingomonas prati]|uniref:histidine kinase n=1 Tax=Sphingomonas prati TaxID=1843237 RepID=A0A7W9BPZ3_9SPHN|nr:HAMP domain-containing sensor histidine kinase [Sphingomonas prati]MBB5727950.1 signal transduction histidine kinase [Sphingomonas prati]
MPIGRTWPLATWLRDRQGRRPIWRSTSARFLLLHLALAVGCTVPALLYVYIKTDQILLEDFQRPLEFRQSNLEKQYRIGGIDKLTLAVTSRAERAHRDRTAILLVDRHGRKLAGNLAAWPAGVGSPQDWTPTMLRHDRAAKSEEYLTLTTRLPTGHSLLLGGLLDNRVDMQTALLRGLAAAFALAIPIGLLGSVVIVHEMNRMVQAIAVVGHQVAAGDLARRATTDGSGDPVDRLRTTLNVMLDRLEVLVGEHRMLTDALAHDLRSPLTRIHIQLAHAQDDAPGLDQRPRFRAIEQEVELVLHMLESALEISRAEAGIGRGAFEAFDAGELLRGLGEIYQPLALSRTVGIAIECASGLDMLGDRGLVARAVANLIDNALKYGVGGGEILLQATAEGDAVHLVVADRANGIPADRRGDALRKFGRLDDARSSPGSGLGLSLVSAVASLHRGTFVLEDNHPGLRARLILPRNLDSSHIQQGVPS